MDQIQKDSTSVKNERDEAVHKMTIMESRFDELQVCYNTLQIVPFTSNLPYTSNIFFMAIRI